MNDDESFQNTENEAKSHASALFLFMYSQVGVSTVKN
jgi:hypothetical protein